MEPTFVPYTPEHQKACVEIFRSNIPKFFLESEVPLFEDYLINEGHQNYWCMVLGKRMIGCGGYWLNDPVNPKSARLVWGIVHADFHHQGYGRKQIEFRLKKLLEIETLESIALDTSQHNPGFFSKFGFSEFKVTENKYGPDLHSHEMELVIKRNK